MDFQRQIAVDSGRGFAVDAPVDERLVFLRKTYMLVFTGLLFAAAGGYAGATYLLESVAQHMWLFFFGYLVACFAAYGLRRVPVVNYLALFGFTFLCGVTLGPLLMYAIAKGGGEPTIILQALTVTGVAFVGLSGYVLVTRKDFSFLGGGLTAGLFVLIGLLVVGMFTGGTTFQFLVSAGGAVLFCGFIVYDTSIIVRKFPTDDAVGAAITLFLDFFLLFLYVLQLLAMLAGGRD